MPLGNRHQRIKVRALAIEVNRNNRLGARRDRSLDLIHVDQEIVVPDVDENRRCAKGADRRDRRHGRVGHRDDLVAGLHAQCGQRDIDGIGSAVDPDTAGHAEIRRHLALELDPLLPEHQPARAEDAIDGGKNLVTQLIVFAKIVPYVDRHSSLTPEIEWIND